MAHNARTERLPAATGHTSKAASQTREAATPDEIEDPLVDLDGALDGVWRLLISMRLGLVLILALAALGLAGTLIVQAPQGVLDSPAAKADWLDQVRPKYGGWTGVLDTLGLFAVFQSFWFRAIAALLTVSTLACTVHRVPGIWRTVAKPHVGVGSSFFEHAPHRATITSSESPEKALGRVRAVLGGRRFRTIVQDDGEIRLYADRFRWVPFAGLAGHLSIAVIVAGALVGGAFGYSDPDFVIAEGSTVAVPTKPGVTIELVRFTDSYYAETGAPSDYASELVVRRDGQEVQRHTARVNDPLRFEDLSFYQAFYGPAASLTVKDDKGATVFADGVALAWRATDGNRPVGSFTIADRGLTVWVVGTGGPDDTIVRPGQTRVEVYSGNGDTPVDSKSLDPGKPATVAGLTFELARELQFTGLSVAKDPGAPLVWLGCALLLGGFSIRFMVPHRRIWGRIARLPDGRTAISLAGLARGDESLGRELAGLVAELESTQPAAARRRSRTA